VCRQSSGPKNDQVRGWRLPASEGIIGWVVANGRSLLVDDAQKDPRHYHGLDHSVELATRSLISIPLLVQGRAIGALQALDSEPARFNESDLALMESLAAAAAFAIENARLYSQARQDAETRTVLLREVNHRVKNNLSAIIGLLYAERRHADLQDKPIYQSIMQDLISRVQGLAAVHDLLSASEWLPVSLTELAEQIIHSALQALPAEKQLIVNVAASSVRVTPDQANYLALVINELTTNALKYALSERVLGQINVDITVDREQIIALRFQDDGPGYPPDVLYSKTPRYNVGLYLLQNIVTHSLHGSLTLQNRYRQDKITIAGAVATIQFELQV
jgi:two-component sensor histidine kinase